MKRTNNRNEASEADGRNAIVAITNKLKLYKIKLASIISLCERLDRNRDHIINMHDLKIVFDDLLGSDSLSAREFRQLAKLLGAGDHNNNRIEYNRLYELFDESAFEEQPPERWYDPEEPFEQPQKKGSVGEWLKKASCPAEVKNFKKFIACLEEFEKVSGMKCVHKDDGFTVPLGPDLRASISFFMT